MTVSFELYRLSLWTLSNVTSIFFFFFSNSLKSLFNLPKLFFIDLYYFLNFFTFQWLLFPITAMYWRWQSEPVHLPWTRKCTSLAREDPLNQLLKGSWQRQRGPLDIRQSLLSQSSTIVSLSPNFLSIPQ